MHTRVDVLDCACKGARVVAGNWEVSFQLKDSLSSSAPLTPSCNHSRENTMTGRWIIGMADACQPNLLTMHPSCGIQPKVCSALYLTHRNPSSRQCCSYLSNSARSSPQKAKPVQVMTCRVPSPLNPSSNSAIRALHLLGNTVTKYHNCTLEDWSPFREFWSSLHYDKGALKGGDLINGGKSRRNSIHKNVDSLLRKASSGQTWKGKSKSQTVDTVDTVDNMQTSQRRPLLSTIHCHLDHLLELLS